MRVAPGVVTTLTAPTVLGVRPYRHAGRAVAGVWEAHIDDHDGQGAKAIFTQGPRPIRFIETYCIFTGGEWAGRPFRMLTWQKGVTCELFELVYDGDGDQFVRRYHEALLGTPKKNGKSDYLAGLAVYFLCGDGEPNPIVITAAANDTSANLVFKPVKVMIEGSHGADAAGDLLEWCDAWEDRVMLRGALNAEIRRVPASPKSTEGLNISQNILDEWHEWTHPAAEQTATKLFNGTVLRPNYMNIRGTTAGFDMESLCGQDYEFGVALAKGEVEAPEWFFRWYEAPEAVEREGRLEPLDWKSEEAVRLSNPSYGALAQWPFYRNKLRSKEGIYRRYFLNQWTAGEESWLPLGAWEACAGGFALQEGEPVTVGIDASYRNDATAVVAVQAQEALDPETDETVELVATQAWIWERPLDPHTRRPREDWVVPRAEVKALIYELATRYRLAHAHYDPAFFHETAVELVEAGLPMLEFQQQNVRKLMDGCQATYDLVVHRRLRHLRQPKFSEHIANAVAKQVATGAAAWVLRKGSAKRKMDAAVALSMAVWGLQHPGEQAKKKGPPTLYTGEDDADE